MNSYKTPIGVKLTESIFKQRYETQRKYLTELKNDNLLQNYYIEAGIKSWYEKPKNIHWGWESPECQLRGHYLGHWLSAAAKMYHQTNNLEIKLKADQIVEELEKCQLENGGKWVGSIPEKYLHWIAKGRHVWAPQYTVHKTLMGLIDMYKYGENKKALEIANRFGDWFYEWTNQFNREEMDNILDFETGGLLETWADMLELTQESKYLSLIEKYYRPRLFDKLLTGEDCLTDKHANTTIPEILGLARLWEVTKDDKYKFVAMEYFKQAVDDRGYFCTGGQTNGESWTPRFELGSRLGNANQEHCVVYNMIRLADFLLRWTGEKKYGDYIERNIYNGLFAQQNIENGTALYYLSLLPNSKKDWGSIEEDFWCCYGTVGQAPTLYPELAFYYQEDSVMLSQFIPSTFECQMKEQHVKLTQYFQNHRPSWLIPNTDEIHVEIECDTACEFELKIRVPWWSTAMNLTLNDQVIETHQVEADGYVKVKRVWGKDKIVVSFKKEVYSSSLPDMPYLTAFMYGPTVLAGLSEERTIYSNEGREAQELLRPINVNRWANVMYYTKDQVENIQFIPLGDIKDEHYTVYFPISSK